MKVPVNLPGLFLCVFLFYKYTNIVKIFPHKEIISASLVCNVLIYCN